MNWENDQYTEEFLNNYLPERFQNYINPALQYPGRNFNYINWANKVNNINIISQYNISSPQNIIECFMNNHYLEGLVLTVSWGTMARQNNRIYAPGIELIENTLNHSVNLIINDESINGAWNLIFQQLIWSPVITSKTLHFISRALGVQNDCPVAIDNQVILNRVWPILAENMTYNQRTQLKWRDGLEGYLRYMTFINFLRINFYPGWTNTQIEGTIFNDFNNN